MKLSATVAQLAEQRFCNLPDDSQKPPNSQDLQQPASDATAILQQLAAGRLIEAILNLAPVKQLELMRLLGLDAANSGSLSSSKTGAFGAVGAKARSGPREDGSCAPIDADQAEYSGQESGQGPNEDG
jgi:hypothetical protein